MAISLRTHKILWGRSGNRCAICGTELVVDPSCESDDPSVVGAEAHIVARSESFTRGHDSAMSPKERDGYTNLILLCAVHHKQVDDQPGYYTAERLRQIKKSHEEKVRKTLSAEDREEQKSDLIYAGYVDEWVSRSGLDDWMATGTWITTRPSAAPRGWYERQSEVPKWLIGRIWPHRRPTLETALFNYKAVLQDFLMVFGSHLDYTRDDSRFVNTKRFYRIEEWNPELYHRLLEEYGEHENLVCDLFFELTRAANLVCDRVRETIFSGFRLREGAVLVTRCCVGFEMKDVTCRPEYQDAEREGTPYPGLTEFRSIRYTRDFVLDPRDPIPPGVNEE